MSVLKPVFHEGDVLSADSLNQLVTWCAQGKLRFGRGFVVHNGVVAIAARPGWWAKITSRGTGANHAWIRQIATAGGGWSDDSTLSGTTTADPAYEANGVTTLSLPTRVWAWRDQETSEVRFSQSQC